MKNYTPFLPILSAVRFVTEMPKGLATISPEKDATAAGNAESLLSVSPLL